MTGDEDFNRMRWASRRGLLELDLLLAPFVEERYQGLSESLQRDFRQLVTCEDQDIMNWIMGRDTVSDPALESVVLEIRAHNASKLHDRQSW